MALRGKTATLLAESCNLSLTHLGEVLAVSGGILWASTTWNFTWQGPCKGPD